MTSWLLYRGGSTYTVEPVYSGHLLGHNQLAVIQVVCLYREPVYSGHL